MHAYTYTQHHQCHSKVEACVGGECKSTPLRKATDSRKGIVDWHQTMDIQLSAMQVLESDNSPVVLRVLDDDDVVLVCACGVLILCEYVCCPYMCCIVCTPSLSPINQQ